MAPLRAARLPQLVDAGRRIPGYAAFARRAATLQLATQAEVGLQSMSRPATSLHWS